MKNRIPDDLLAPAPEAPPTPTPPDEMLHVAQKQLNQFRQWIETYVQERPAVGMGAALCIGVVIGWINKRR